MFDTTLRRRDFLRKAAASLGAAVAMPAFVGPSALGADGTTPPSDRITIAPLGYGGRSSRTLPHFMAFTDAQCIAVADCRSHRREAAKKVIDAKYGTKDCDMHADFRELLDRKDLDAVMIATGDRWHSLASIHAAKAGKDVYCEKPISLTIAESRAMADTMARFGTIYQAGHQRRSVDSYRFQVEVAQSGAIGKLRTIQCRNWAGAKVGPAKVQPIPKGFDYDMWLGPTPWHPFTNARVGGWNYFWDTGAGIIVAMGCHYTDIAQWCHDSDDTTPVEYDGKGVFDPTAYSETPITADVACTYADGVKVILESQGAFADRFIKFIGSEGWIQVDDQTNLVTASSPDILKRRSISARTWAHTGGHVRNWLDSIKSRRPTVCPPETAHRATTMAHAANISIRLGRKLKFDPKAERFIGDDEANRMISRRMRAPWTL